MLRHPLALAALVRAGRRNLTRFRLMTSHISDLRQLMIVTPFREQLSHRIAVAFDIGFWLRGRVRIAPFHPRQVAPFQRSIPR